MLTRYLIGALAAATLLTGLAAWWKNHALTNARAEIAALEADSDRCVAANAGYRDTLARIRRQQQDAIEAAQQTARIAEEITEKRNEERDQHQATTARLRSDIAELASTECSSHVVRPGFVAAHQRLLDAQDDLRD